MATLTSDQGTLIISVPAGSSLRVYSKSGTPTVSGSSVSVEDVTTTLGCYVYGPQTSNSTITLTTTGVLVYDIVAGDPTPTVDGGPSVTVVNDLTTGGSAAALSAEQGKSLKGQVDAAASGLGPVANLATLNSSYPAAANKGKQALVGSAAPYQEYQSNGATWEPLGSVARLFPQYRMRRLWSDAFAKAAHRRILCVGDSTTAGNTSYSLGWPTRAVSMLQGMGYPVIDGSVFSPHNTGTLSGSWAFDPRVTFSASGVAQTGFMFPTFTFSTGGTLSFTPTEQFTNFRVYYLVNSAATISYQIDGGAATNIVFTTTGSPTWAYADITGVTLGTHTIQLNYVSGSPNVVGIEVWNAADPKVSIINAGQNGQSLQAFMNPGSGWTWAKFLEGCPIDAAILELGTNDYPYTAAQYETSLTSFITACQAANVELVVGVFPPNNGWGDGNIANADAKRDLIRKVCSIYSVPCVDLHRRWGGAFATMNALGYYTDTVHPTASGACDKALAYADALTSLPNFRST